MSDGVDGHVTLCSVGSHQNETVRADAAIPDHSRMFYFEIRIEEADENSLLAIGILPLEEKQKVMPGCTIKSYGYHSDATKSVRRTEGTYVRTTVVSDEISGKGEPYGSRFGREDVVGCGMNIKKGILFFTKNGEYLGVASKNVRGRFIPTVGVLSNTTVTLQV